MVTLFAIIWFKSKSLLMSHYSLHEDLWGVLFYLLNLYLCRDIVYIAWTNVTYDTAFITQAFKKHKHQKGREYVKTGMMQKKGVFLSSISSHL